MPSAFLWVKHRVSSGKERPHVCLWQEEKRLPKRSQAPPKGGIPSPGWGWQEQFPTGDVQSTQLIHGKPRRSALSRPRLEPGPPAPKSLASREHVWSSQCPAWGWHPGGTRSWSHMLTCANSHSPPLFINFMILELRIFNPRKLVLLSSG